MVSIDKLWDLIKPELQFEAVKSSGPGGQHINKTNTKVILRWDIANSKAISPEQREAILHKLSTHINKDEIFIITDQNTRSQLKNKISAGEKLFELLKKAFQKPKKRKATKPTYASVKKRLEQKKRLSIKKEQRKRTD